LLCLRRQGRHEMRMRVAQNVDRDSAAEIEESLPGSRENVGAFAPFECDFGPGVGREQRRDQGSFLCASRTNGSTAAVFQGTSIGITSVACQTRESNRMLTICD